MPDPISHLQRDVDDAHERLRRLESDLSRLDQRLSQVQDELADHAGAILEIMKLPPMITAIQATVARLDAETGQ